MSDSIYTDKFKRINNQQSKLLNVVVKIEDCPNIYGLVDTYTLVRYGDPVFYGQEGLKYGSLRKIGGNSPYLTLEGSLSIAQRLEPEQGRASISTFNLTFLDVNGEITKLISQNQIVDELLGGKLFKVYIGYQNVSWPEDYYIVFRGYATGYTVNNEKITINLSDANQKRRQNVFDIPETKLATNINNSATYFDLLSTVKLYRNILTPDLSLPPIKTFIQIDDEIMRVENIDTIVDNDITVTRAISPIGYQSLSAQSHTQDSTVLNLIEIGPMNAIDMALSIMLSGWGGPYKSDVRIISLAKTYDENNPRSDCIHLSYTEDAIEDYGLAIGDYITVSGSLIPANNGQCRVVNFGPDFTERNNRLIYVDKTFTTEEITSSPDLKLAMRSQFDILPLSAGLKMSPTEIDVAEHIRIRDWFLNGPEYDLWIAIGEKQSGKEFIEKEIYFPIGCYSLTRYGKLSLGYTRPPVPLNNTLVVVNKDNIIQPNTIVLQRSLVNRRFFNEIIFEFDKNNTTNIFETSYRLIDTDSLNRTKQTSTLRIESLAIRSLLSGETLATKVVNSLLGRFKNAATEITLKTNFGAGVLIEAGDVVLLQDNGDLHLPNFATGKRNIGEQMFEVIDRKLTLKDGTCELKLLGGIVDTRNDRYAVISPSSQIIEIISPRRFKIAQDQKEVWLTLVGNPVRITPNDWESKLDGNCGSFEFVDYANGIIEVSNEIDDPIEVGDWLEIQRYNTNPESIFESRFAFAVPEYAAMINAFGSDEYFLFNSDLDPNFNGTWEVGGLVALRNEDETEEEIGEIISLETVNPTVTKVNISINVEMAVARIAIPLYFSDKKGAYRLV